ncbi:MAG: hypothetical protein U0T31_01610 [Chitinophagales bacterium]
MSINNYWIKDETRKETITKTQIPNAGNFDVFATYYNLMDKQGLSFSLNFENDLVANNVYRKNNLEYFVLQYNDWKELYILPNENIVEYTNKVVSKINNCKTENEVLSLLIAEM